jgi:hypothetical protein
MAIDRLVERLTLTPTSNASITNAQLVMKLGPSERQGRITVECEVDLRNAPAYEDILSQVIYHVLQRLSPSVGQPE